MEEHTLSLQAQGYFQEGQENHIGASARRLNFGEEPAMTHNNDNRPLREFSAPKANIIQLGYTVPTVGTNNFELKSARLNILSQHMFHGLAHED
jgi:hypothetical protein